jgi:hypothetical protein
MPRKRAKKTISIVGFRWEKAVLVRLGVILGIGVSGLGFWGLNRYFYWRSLIGSLEAVNSRWSVGVEPTVLKIDDLIAVAVEPMRASSGTVLVSETKASWFLGSSTLDKPGNVIVYGHNKQEILGNLPRIRVGDEVTLEGIDGEAYRYRVTVSKPVGVKDISWLEKTTQPVVTIYTCYGFMDSQRWIVRGELSREE